MSRKMACETVIFVQKLGEPKWSSYDSAALGVDPVV